MLTLLLSLALALAVAAPPRCRFALEYTCDGLLRSPPALSAFLHAYASAQSAFASDGIGLDAASGLTFDGHAVDYLTGAPSGAPHPFSAASKESIHTALLALAIRNNSLAQAALGAYPAALGAYPAALAAAAKKLASYTAFNASRPGYGCHLPWFLVPSMAPTADWATPARVPALDNGELAWAVFALADALGAAAAAAGGGGAVAGLAAGWGAWFTCMASNAPALFYQGGGRVAAVVAVRDPAQPPSNNSYTPSAPALLSDPYEGETMTVLLHLFGPGLSAQERAALWQVKAAALFPTNLTSPAAGATITAQTGFWFSAHEQWKAALLPYLAPATGTPARVLRNSERARTWHSVDAGWPGLLASATDLVPPSSPRAPPPGYVSAAGVRQLGTVGGAYRTDLFAPYGAWVALLVNQSVGACWLRNVLAAARAQGPVGATEAVAGNGSAISPLATWDTTMTVVLSAAGGVGAEVGAALRRLPSGAPPAQGWQAPSAPLPHGSAHDVFQSTLEGVYAGAFEGGLGGEDAGFGLPQVAVPDALSPWPACV